MSFLNLSLLGGALLVAVPIALHLIMRQRPQLVQFPALQFVLARSEANRRQLRLRHWVLLVLRCAAIGLLALALARPSWTAGANSDRRDAPLAAAFVFDSSPRMAYMQENLTRLQKAQQEALWLLRRAPEDSKLAVVDSGASRMAFAVDAGAVSKQVERLQITPRARLLDEALADAISLVAGEDDHRQEVYVFTDLAQQSWNSAALARLQSILQAQKNVQLHIVDISAEEQQNTAIQEMSLNQNVLPLGGTLVLDATLYHQGPPREAVVELLMQDSETEQSRGRRRVTWEQSGEQQIQFRVDGLGEGTHQGRLQLNADDPLDIDNVWHFTVEVRSPPTILIAAEDEEHAIYLREALAPSDWVQQNRARFQVETVGFPQLSGVAFANYAAIALLDPPILETKTWASLTTYVTEGGELAIYLGREADRDSFNQPAPQTLLPGPLLQRAQGELYFSIDNYSHPSLAAFAPYADQVPWPALPVFKYWQLEQLDDGVQQVIRLSDGQPAMLEQVLGKGRVVTVTTPVSDAPNAIGREAWNLLPVGLDVPWPFVLWSRELFGYLAGQDEDQVNYLPGETVSLQLTPAEQLEVFRKKGYVVRGPDGEATRHAATAGQEWLTIATTDLLGNYQVVAGGTTGLLKRGFSTHLPPKSTDMRAIDTAVIAEELGEDRVHFAKSREQIERQVGIARHGTEFFSWLVGIVAVVLAAEHVAANRFYKS